MSKFSISLSVFVLLAMLLTACGGQQSSTNVPSTNVPPVTEESTSTSEANMTTTPEGGSLTTTPGVPVTGAENPSRLSNLMGFTAMDQNGNEVGKVSDLVLDLDNTRVSYVVVDANGKSVLVPWDSLQLQTGTGGAASAQQNAFVLLADPQLLNSAPDTDIDSILPGMGQPAGDWDAEIRNFWESGAVSGTPAADAGTTTTNTPSANTTTTPSAPSLSTTATTASNATVVPEMTATSSSASSQGQAQGLGQGQTLQGVMLASDVIGATITLNAAGDQGQGQGLATSTPAAGAATSAATAAATVAATSAATANPSTTATSSTAQGTGNTGLSTAQATIADIIVEPAAGNLQDFVIKVTFDDGEHLIPVPLLGFLQWDVTNNSFMLKVDANALQNAPFFTEDQLPDTTTPGWDAQFSDFWNSMGSGTGTGTVTGATATPAP